MKRIILVSLLAIFACGTNCIAANKQSSKATIVFNVPMDCQGCVTKIEKNIAFEKGVIALDINLEKQIVKVVYNTNKTTKENLIAAFEKIGKKAKEVKTILSSESTECQPKQTSK